MKTIVLAKQGSHSLASRTFQDFPEPPKTFFQDSVIAQQC